MTPLVIYGGSFATILKTVARINAIRPTWRVIGFVDDMLAPGRAVAPGIAVLGDAAVLPGLLADGALVFHNVRGSAAAARIVAGKIAAAGAVSCDFVDPDVDMLDVRHGPGFCAAQGVLLSAPVRFGACCTLRLGAIVSHDAVLGDHVLIGPGAVVGSHVAIGDDVEVGAGAVVAAGARIGAGSRIGAGAVVVRDVPPDSRVVPVPGPRAPPDGGGR
jgi:acetyltransferase-like isoleucine patch superfamily enzyme